VYAVYGLKLPGSKSRKYQLVLEKKTIFLNTSTMSTYEEGHRKPFSQFGAGNS